MSNLRHPHLSPPGEIKTVAVLPFQQYSDAARDLILSALADYARIVLCDRIGSVLGYRQVPLQKTPQNLLRATMQGGPGEGTALVREWGESLRADFLLSGVITGTRKTEGGQGVQVTLSLHLADTITGEMCNGAISTGKFAGKGTEKELQQHAVEVAMGKSLAAMAAFKIPEANILQVLSPNRVLISAGKLEQIMVRTGFSVIRGRRKIGEIRVIEVNARESVADVVRGESPQRGDWARAYFRICS